MSTRWFGRPRWQVITAAGAVVALLVVGVGFVVWKLDPGCTAAFGGRSADPGRFPGKASTAHAEVTAANLAFTGDDILGRPIWNSSADGDVSSLGTSLLQDDDKFYGAHYTVSNPANGRPLWSRERPTGRRFIPGGVLGLEVDRDDSARVARFDAGNGSLSWCRTLPYEVSHNAKGAFAIASDDPKTLAVVTSDPHSEVTEEHPHPSTLSVVDTESGKLRWTVGFDTITQDAVVGSGMVVTMDGGSTGDIYTLTAYDAGTGARLWRQPIPVRLAPSSIKSNVKSALWGVRGDRVLTAQERSYGTQPAAAVAFDRSGKVAWSTLISTTSVSDDRGLLTDNLLVTAGPMGDRPLQGLRISDGTVAWTGPGSLGQKINNSVTYKGKLYLPSSPLQVVDLATGKNASSAVRCDGLAIINDTLACRHNGYSADLGGSTVAYPLRST